MTHPKSELTPKEIVNFLDKYIIGQKEAKRHVAIALRNRWRRINAPIELQNDIIPNNILMIGSTGIGKTEIARRLARIANAPFIKVEASKFTEVGYVGRDVESMIRDLVEQSIYMVKTQKKDAVAEKATISVEETILDALLPKYIPTDRDTSIMSTSSTNNVNAKEELREKLRSGEIDNEKVELDLPVSSSSGPNFAMGGLMDDPNALNSVKEMLQNLLPKKHKKRKLSIGDAKKILFEEESSKLIDMDEVKEEALKKAEHTGIIFIDEIDKIAVRSSHRGGTDISHEGVQRDLLPIVEGSAVNTKYGTINTDHMLFISAGAFHMAKPSDLIPELQGRFPIRVELDSLKKEDFYRILTEPKTSLTKQYIALFQSEQVTLHFEDEALQEIASLSFDINEEVENIGARRLHTVMSQILKDFLFDVPDAIKPKTTITITKEMVNQCMELLGKRKDFSDYIL